MGKQHKRKASFKNYKITPLWRETLPLEERLDYLIRELTLGEKMQCLTVRAPEVERLGLKSFAIGGEAAHGVEARHDQVFNKDIPVETTVFTQPIGMSATWDTGLIEKVGVVTGTEARAVYRIKDNIGLSRWGPTVDMERDPRWGRTEEGYGEDPYLTGKMSSAYILGLQGRDAFYLRCGATLKHFYANNEEKDREKSSSSLDARNKHEYYLEPFRRAVLEGKAEAVMTSYNEINGIPAIVNPEVQEIIKDGWGLRGHVVCDMGDLTQNVTAHNYCKTDAMTLALGMKAGIDAFNDQEEVVIAAAKEALKNGLITEEDINRSIRNTFATKLRLGIYDAGNRCPYSGINTEVLNCREHQKICLEAANKAMVLLKNEEQRLPLDGGTKEAIAVVGPLADVWYKDWYCGIPASRVTPMEGIRREFPYAELHLAEGMDRIRIRVGEQYLAVKQDGACCLSDENSAEIFEHTDWGDNKHTLCACSSMKYLSADYDTGIILANREEVFSWFVQEVFSFCKPHKKKNRKINDYILESWNHTALSIDEEGSLLCGSGNARNNNEDRDTVGFHCNEEETVFSFELVVDGIGQAVETAKKADKVIAVMGCHPTISCKEGTDRTDYSLPPVQRKLLQEIKKVNPNVILVLITNYPYAIEWEKENLPAILMTASGSQELGTAIAGAIAGTYSPAGRLNMTWYLAGEQLPGMRDYDIIHTKRTYQYFDKRVLYPFGYGLTYTEFFYQDLKVFMEADHLKITLLVKNTGLYDSDEVVQLYVTQLHSRTVRPIKQLKGFERIFIKFGEERTVEFLLPFEELKYYDVVTGKMLIEDSDYELQIGSSSQDTRLEGKVHIHGMVIPDRDMAKTIPCDHYDSYENIYLHLGHDNKPCILPKAMKDEHRKVSGSAVYRDAVFYFRPDKFVIAMKSEEEGMITVWFGTVQLVKINCTPFEDFKKITVPLITDRFKLGEKNSLVIEISGRQKIIEFSFR